MSRALPRGPSARVRRAAAPLVLTASAFFAAACGDMPTSPGDAASDAPLGTAGSGDPATTASYSETLEVWWPTEGASLTGTHIFKARLVGWSLYDYRLYWGVDGGQLNEMSNSSEGGDHKRATVSVDSWTWRGAGPYLVTFVATPRKGKKSTLAERSVSIQVGTAVTATVEALQPTDGATLEGVTPFSARVAELPATGYVMHWRVDGGQLNPMSDAADGTSDVAQVDVSTWTWSGAGPYTVTFVAFDGDLRLGESSVQIYVSTTPPPPPSGDLFSDATFYVDPYSNAQKTADEWSTSRPADAEQMEKIAAQPQADWFGEWSGDIRSAVDQRVSTITAAGALPVLIAYMIPGRDCNGYSEGGSATADAYKSWIGSFAAGIGSRKAVVVLEPDALAALDCLPAADQQSRLELLAYAVATLKAQDNTAVYVDAGHPLWKPALTMADRLRSAGIAQADGFSLNVSNFVSNAENKTYGEEISSYLGGSTHFIVDSSRNGLGSNGEWCNPDSRALGTNPTAATSHSLLDAYFWLKRPGESDGTCNGGPSAGSWWEDYALGLAQRQTGEMAIAVTTGHVLGIQP